MNVAMAPVVYAILIGAGATLVIDAWALGRKRLRGICATGLRSRRSLDCSSRERPLSARFDIGVAVRPLMSPLPLAGEAAPKARVRGRLRSASLRFPSSGACESSSFAPSETDIPWPWLRY